jgi:hypothetical protein
LPIQPQHVGVLRVQRHHRLRHAHRAERVQLVAQARRRLVTAFLGSLLHLAAQAHQQLLVAAGQEHHQGLDQRAILGRRRAAARRAGAGAAADVKVEARPVRAPVVLEIAARAHRERAADLAQHAPQ